MTLYIQPFPYRRMARRWVELNAASGAQHLPVDVRDNEDEFVLTALVPGLKAEDLDIQILDDVLRIEGEYVRDEAEYLLRELPGGSFRRTLRLPAAMDADKADAKIKDGILTLRLPKAESARPKKIKVAVK